jgi:hypothetical protein
MLIACTPTTPDDFFYEAVCQLLERLREDAHPLRRAVPLTFRVDM